MKKLTTKEIRERIIKKLFGKIKNFERIYNVLEIRSACFRYYSRRGEELKLKREIKNRENELNELKGKLIS